MMELTAHTRTLIDLALMEDMSGGDITTRATITTIGTSSAASARVLRLISSVTTGSPAT